MASNMPLLDKVSIIMHKLGIRFKENNLFVSQGINNTNKEATVLMNLICDHKDLDECYLQIRRLLNALKYRIDENSPFEFEFNLKRKKE